jgi:hypothetical protein
MLSHMIDEWALWLLLVGFAVGVAATAVLLWRLPRREDDVAAEERRVEAAWIADTIERHGGSAPESFVEEVLDLHQAYLGLARPPGPPPGVAVPPVPPPGYAPSPRVAPAPPSTGQFPPQAPPPPPPPNR